MASGLQPCSPDGGKEDGDGLVLVRKRDLEKLRSEVQHLREFLPRLVHTDLQRLMRKARAGKKKMEFRVQDVDRLRLEVDRLKQECVHLMSRLETLQSDCHRERESKLVLRQQLWSSRQQLQQQAEFCVGLGSSSLTLLWRVSGKEAAVSDLLADQGKLQSFLAVAGQTLESFVRSLEDKTETDSHLETQLDNNHSPEQQFVLAVAGVIANIAAVTCGRDFLSSSSLVLLDTMMQLLMTMKTGVFPRLKVLMLMALYNVSISVKGLKYISESPGLLQLIWTLLEDPWEVCVNALRLLQSLLLDEAAVSLLAPRGLLEIGRLQRVEELSLSRQSVLKDTALEVLREMRALMDTQGPHSAFHSQEDQ